MGNYPSYTTLRKRIDRAITYNDIETALTYARKGLQRAEEEEILSEQFYFRAQFEIIHNEFENAIPLLDKAIEYNPHDGAAFNDRALCMVEIGMADDAIAYFDRGIAVEPDYATIYHNKAWLLNKLGKHRDALALFKKALELEPKRAVTYENIANAYENLGEIINAIEAYTHAMILVDSQFPHIREQIAERIKKLHKKIFSLGDQ